MKQFNSRTGGRYGGLGMLIEKRGEFVTVNKVYRNTPAERAGVRAGDRIIKVDTLSTQGWDLSKVSDYLTGTAGTRVGATFSRPGVPTPLELKFTRAIVNVPAVPYALMYGKVGYIPLEIFNENAAEGVEAAIKRLTGEGAKGIVLDLRGNGGGYIEAGVRILRRLVPNGSVYRVAERNVEPVVRDLCGPSPTSRTGAAILSGRQLGEGLNVADDDSCSGEPVLAVPLAVLIDEFSASTSEFVASAIEENQAGRVFGATTRGGLAASLIVPLADGSALQLGYAQILTGEGRRINRVGVRPDEVVEFQIEALQSGTDTQLARAITYLRDSASRPARIMRLRSEQPAPAAR
jgi:carboxyl-terminal processing protease